jgi:oxidase EvaA
MSGQENIGWLRDRLKASLAIEPKDPAEPIGWLEARRKDVPFSAELIPLREVADWRQADNGNIYHATGQFFRIEGVRVRSAPGLREISGWDQPILTQSEGGILALLCRETTGKGIEFLLQAKADPGNVGYLQFCPTIQSTWENIRGLKGAKRAPFAEYLDPSKDIRVIYRSKHNEEGSRSGRNQTRI